MSSSSSPPPSPLILSTEECDMANVLSPVLPVVGVGSHKAFAVMAARD